MYGLVSVLAPSGGGIPCFPTSAARLRWGSGTRAKPGWQGDALTPPSTGLGYPWPRCWERALQRGAIASVHPQRTAIYPLRGVPRAILAPVSPAHPSCLSGPFPAKVTRYGRQFTLHASKRGSPQGSVFIAPTSVTPSGADGEFCPVRNN